MKKLVKLGTTDDMPAPGRLKRFVCEGVALCVANVKGDLRALGDECPHKGVSLSGGKLKGKRVLCPRHEWRFRTRDGACKQHPGYEAATYPMFATEDEILVQL